jgi:hypothetical protein
MSNKIQRYLNYIADPRARRSLKGLFSRFDFNNAKQLITWAEGPTIPPAAGSGYAPGCMFVKSDAVLGQSMYWINSGTATSCLFVPFGPVFGYGIHAAGGPVTSVGGDTTEVISLEGIAMDTDIALVNHEISDDNDQIVAAISGEGNITITGSADPLTAHGYAYALLRNKCTPQWDVFAAGTATTAGGAAAEAITVTGVLATDIALANYSATDDTDTISDILCSANTVTVTCSADPSTTHGLHYAVLRPRGTFKPSHYVAYAGVHTTVGGAAAEAITVTGALATDIPIVVYNTTDDTDSILKAVMTANTLTVTCSADPSTAHKLAYMVLRAY